MPQNTKVWRCVEKLKKKYKYKGAIAICQATTKQNYKTGKKIQTQKKKPIRKKDKDKNKKNKNTQRKKKQTKKTHRQRKKKQMRKNKLRK